MKWRFFSSWTKKNKQLPAAVRDFDHMLIKSVRHRSIPSFAQFKYITRFLTKKEKRLIKLAMLLIALSLVSAGIIFLVLHIAFEPKSGGEYSEALIGQPKLINPLFSGTNDVDADLSALIYTGLFSYNKDEQITPDLAESFSVSDDKKIYTVILKKNLFWSDGEPLTADDVVFTFESIQNPEVGSPLFPAFQGVKIEKTEEGNITFTLKDAYAPFIHNLTIGIIPEHTWAEIPPANIRLAKTNLQPIGSGPWKFEKMLQDDIGNIQAYVLSKNDKYYGQVPYLKTLNFKFYTDFPPAIDALRSQNISAVSFVPHQYEEKLGKKNLNIYQLELPQYTALFFNQNQSAALKDVEVRQALGMALDKKTILQEALNNEGKLIDAPILKGSVGYYPEIAKINFNVDEANKLLDKKWTRIAPEEYYKLKSAEVEKSRQEEIEAMKKNPSSTPEMVSSTLEKIQQETADAVRAGMSSDQVFYRKDKSGNILSLTITTAETPEYSKAVDIIAKMWKSIGVQTPIQTVASRQFNREVLKERNYEILLYGEIIGSDPDLFPFWHSSQSDYPGLNLSMFVDRSADKLLEEARAEGDSEKRGEKYKKFQDILAKELPAIFLYTPTYIFAVNKEVGGIDVSRISNPSDRFIDSNKWYVKRKWIWK